MARTISAGEALGHRRMQPGAKEEVIAYLAAASVPVPQRRKWYREWCGATGVKVDRSDLDRVGTTRKPKGQQMGLYDHVE